MLRPREVQGFSQDPAAGAWSQDAYSETSDPKAHILPMIQCRILHLKMFTLRRMYRGPYARGSHEVGLREKQTKGMTRQDE